MSLMGVECVLYLINIGHCHFHCSKSGKPTLLAVAIWQKVYRNKRKTGNTCAKKNKVLTLPRVTEGCLCSHKSTRKDARVVEEARLESV